jgi:hypothetical protein
MSTLEQSILINIGLLTPPPPPRITCDECEAECTSAYAEYEHRNLCLDCDAHVGRYRPWTIEEILAREG